MRPDDRAEQCRQNKPDVDDCNIDNAFADRVRDMNAESKRRDEIEECGPEDRNLRRQDAGGNDRRNRIRRIVHPVHEIKDKGKQYDNNDQSEHV
jgi:hypothetical protein